MRLRPPHSLRTRLLWFLFAAISITAVAQALVAYRTARAEADDSQVTSVMAQLAPSHRRGVSPSSAPHARLYTYP